MDEDDDDFQWLSEQVADEEVAALFTEDSESLKLAVRHLIARACDDYELERELIDTLDLAMEQSCDDGGVTPWIAVILGEVASTNALGVLSRCIAWDGDETLQDAASVALVRVGSSAVAYLIDEIEEDRGVEFQRAAYRVLGETGILEDEVVRQRILDFLDERYFIEEQAESAYSGLEALAEAAARIGHRELLPRLRDTLKKRFRGHHPVLEDVVEALEENEAGVPFIPTIPPWEERYGWLYEDAAERARVPRPERPEASDGPQFPVQIKAPDIDLEDDETGPEDSRDPESDAFGLGGLDPRDGFRENPFRSGEDSEEEED